MVDSALKEYIARQLKAGSSAQDVTSFLLQKGYSQQSIAQSLAEIYNNPPQHPEPKGHKSLPFIFIILLILGIIAGLAYFLFAGLQDTDDSLVKFNIDFSVTSFSSDESISFRRSLDNRGSDSSVSVRIVYDVFDSEGNNVHTLSENALLTTTLSKEVIIEIPNIKSGTYSLHATANYKGKSEKRTASFNMVDAQKPTPGVETCFDSIKNQDEEGVDCGGPCKACVRQCPIYYDDNDECTIDKCSADTNFIPVYEPIVPCCGNGICETGEAEDVCEQDCGDDSQGYFDRDITPSVDLVNGDLPLSEKLEKIREMSNSDKTGSMELCDSIILEYYKDECFYGIAEELSDGEVCKFVDEERTKDKCYTLISKATEDSTQCASIASDLRRDSCYMRFALKSDYTVCDKIKDSYYVQSCNQLKEISQTAPEVIAEYSKDVE